MDRTRRAWFGLTALVVGFGLVVQTIVAATGEGIFFHTPLTQGLNVFAFFTIQSNLIVGGTSLLLAIDPNRSSTVFRVFRLSGIVAITITGIVYHSVLRQLFDLETWALVADNVVHTIVPVLAVVVWLAYGPRGRTSRRIAWLSVLFPVAWLIFTLIRGEIVGFYPYPFIDVAKLGYVKVFVNSVWVSVLYLGIAAGVTAIDVRLGRSNGWHAQPRAVDDRANPPPVKSGRAVGLGAICDFRAKSFDEARSQSFSVAEFVTLEDGRRVILHEDRGFTIGWRSSGKSGSCRRRLKT